jgi:predicted nucleotidyltransferase
VDYVRPVETVIPGVPGKVLGVLARTDAELTMRTVASLASVSFNRATSVLNHLVSLGIVERREAGSAALVRLARENAAAQLILALSDLKATVMGRLEETARSIHPAPSALVVFGSFARGEATRESDIDVLAVRARKVDDSDETWLDSLGRWTSRASAITGNPVNLLLASETELPQLLTKRGSVWDSIAKEGISIGVATPAWLGERR